MTLRETQNVTRFAAMLETEIRNALIPTPIPSAGALETGLRRGDILLDDSLDDPRTDGRGVVCWITAERWNTGAGLAIQQLWGPSTYEDGTFRYLDLLIELCQWGVARDLDPRFQAWPRKLADTPTRFSISSRALPQLAVQTAGVSVDPLMRYGTSTMRSALALLLLVPNP